MSETAPLAIGVFDSGAGGLTVLRQLLRLLPAARYIYFGDTARLPYGSKSAETVQRYAAGATRFLEERGAGRIIVACNTASALALPAIAQSVKVPVHGVIESGADTAAGISVNRKAAVIATEATVASHAYRIALEGRGLQVREMACPLLVPLVEEGWLDHPVTEQITRIYLDRLFAGETAPDAANGADVLVLGCTHYPLLKDLITRLVPAGVSVVDSAESIAAAVYKEIHSSSPAGGTRPASLRGSTPGETGASAFGGGLTPAEAAVEFYVSDSAEKFRALGQRLLGAPLNHVQHVDIDS